MVKSYDDSIKQKSREKLRDFIAKNLLTFRKPSQIKVVCFPGAEVKGEEALEVKQVYDKLGIPRKNITGLEVDVEKAERLRKANLGIEIVNSLDLDFFKNEDKVFDVISLDYTGYRDISKSLTLYQIAGRQRLYGNGILATNYSANREQVNNQAFIISLQPDKYVKDIIINEDGTINTPINIGELINKFEKDRQSLDLRELRDSLSYQTLSIMRTGKSILFPLEILKAHPFYEEGMKILKNFEEKSNNKYLMDIFREKYNLSEMQKDVKASNPLSPEYMIMNYTLLLEHIKKQLFGDSDSGIEGIIAKRIVESLINTESKPYFPKTIERYEYISNKKTAMQMDLFAFTSADRIFRRLNEDICYNKKNYKIRVEGINGTDKIYYIPDKNKIGVEMGIEINSLKKMMRVIKDIQECDNILVPERIYLGSSWIPPKRKEKISKEDAIELLREGCPPSEIFDCYRGFTKKQLGAYRAHYVTMGKNVVN